MFATVPPVTIPAPLSGGSESRSITQSQTARSIPETAGVSSADPAFCPHAETRKSAATPTGCDAAQHVAEEVGAAIWCTAPAEFAQDGFDDRGPHSPASGSGPPNRATASSRPTVGRAGRRPKSRLYPMDAAPAISSAAS